MKSRARRTGWRVVLAGLALAVGARADTITLEAFALAGFAYPGGRLDAAAPGAGAFVAINLHTREARLLARDFGESHIVAAKLHDDGRLDPVEPALPSTHIPRALARLRAGEPLRVRCYGTSLVAGGTSAQGWQRLVFEKGELSGVTVSSHAVGGTHARYTAALLGEGSAAFDCDLAIIGLLPNGGADRLAVFEGVVRMFRGRGVEVLLVTDNSFADRRAGDGLWHDGAFVRRLAEHYHCALADTAAWVRSAEALGEKVFVDSIHPSEAGHRAWALAVSGALAHGLVLPAAPALDGLPPPLEGPVPAAVHVEHEPAHEGGAVTDAPANQLARLYGREPRQLELSVSDELVIGRPGILSADLVVDVSSPFVAEVIEPAEWKRAPRTLTHKAPPKIPARPQTVTVFTAGALRGMEDPSCRLRVTEGTLRLFAVSYQLPEPPRSN